LDTQLSFNISYDDRYPAPAPDEGVYPANTLSAAFQYNQPGYVQGQVSTECNLHPSLRSTILYSSAERYDDGLPTPTPSYPFGCLSTNVQSTQGTFVDIAPYASYGSQSIPQDVIPIQYPQQQQPYLNAWHDPYASATANHGNECNASPAGSFDDASFTFIEHSSLEMVANSQVVKFEAASPQLRHAGTPLRHLNETKYRVTKRRSATAMRNVKLQECGSLQGRSPRAEGREHRSGKGGARSPTKSSNKEHRCRFKISIGEECGESFDRVEHLTRHGQSHVPEAERKYFCVVEGCLSRTKRIARSDNACQHFRTHLLGDAKGKRNHHKTWAELKQGIVDQYDPKSAYRLIKTMEKNADLQFQGRAILCPHPPA
jgi:hypothetical protein